MAAEAKKEVEFRVRKEDWSKYEILQGRGVIWVRIILIKLHELSGSAPPSGSHATPVYEGQNQLLVTSFFHPELRTTDSSKMSVIPNEEIQAKGADIPFQTLDEPWNEYLVAGPKPRLIQSKCVATRVHYLADRFNKIGDPAVWVEAGIVFGSPKEAKVHDLR